MQCQVNRVCNVTFGRIIEYRGGFISEYGMTIATTAIALPLAHIDFDISTFGPDEPYRVKKPLTVHVVGKECDFTASHWESNTHTTGESESEAVDNLKSLLLDVFDSLLAEPKETLGPKPAQQLAVLQEYIERVK